MRKSCGCKDPSLEDVISGDGRVMGHLCRRCMLPHGLECLVCHKLFRDVTIHLRRNEVCREAYKARKFWGYTEAEQQRPTAGGSLYPFQSEPTTVVLPGIVDKGNK